MRVTRTFTNALGSIETEMELPDRWCPECCAVRTPAICRRILPGSDLANRCNTPTIPKSLLDAETRKRFDERLRRLAGTAEPQA